jgi:uroporphyrinogen-III synthase
VAVLDGDVGAINKAKVACIGPATSSAAAKTGIRVDVVAQEHTIPGLVSAIELYFKSGKEGGS